MGQRQLAPVVAPDRLRVLPGAAAGGRVAHVADRHVALQRPQLLLVEDLGDESRVAHRGDVAALAGRDPGRLLAAVLQRVEAEVGEAGDVVAGRVYAKHPAFLARAVAVDEHPLGQVKARFPRDWKDVTRRRTAYPRRVPAVGDRTTACVPGACGPGAETVRGIAVTAPPSVGEADRQAVRVGTWRGQRGG